MIRLFQKSVFQCNSLQTAFKAKEHSRTGKIIYTKAERKKLDFLKNEEQDVREFFTQLNIGEDMPSYQAHINMKYMS